MGMAHDGSIDGCECDDCTRRRGWLDELERLEAAVSAISGDWETGGPYPSVSVITCVDGGSWGECPEPPVYEPICQIHTDSRPDAPPPPESAVLLARFIAALRNHARDLIEAARRCEELEAAVRSLARLWPAERWATLSGICRDHPLIDEIANLTKG